MSARRARSTVVTAELQLDAVDVKLGGTLVLRDVDLVVEHGVTALVGRQGAGKSTLIRVVSGTVGPAHGRLLRSGHDVVGDREAMREHRRSMGWVPQDPRFHPRMKVDRVLTYAAWLKEIPTEAQPAAVDAALELGDLTQQRQVHVGALSEGERRWVALVAALVGDPRLLLLDEPTHGLDPDQRGRLLDLVRTFAAGGRAVLIATRVLEEVEAAADRWCVIEGGEVVAAGPA